MVEEDRNRELFLAYRGRLLTYANGIVGDPERAEDVVQEAFLRYRDAATTRSVREPAAYLHRIVRNLAVDLQRRLKTESQYIVGGSDEIALEIPEPNPSPESTAAAREELKNLFDVLAITSFSGTATAAPQNLSFYYQNLVGTAGIRGIADTGPIGHEFNVNATAVQQILGAGYSFGQNYATNIYNPTYVASPNLPTPAANLSSITNLNSVAIADTLSLADKRVQLTVGARLQQVASTNYNRFTGEPTSSYNQTALTPSVALVLKPFWQNVSFYGNWIQGLQQGTVVSATYSNAGEVFPPYVTNQYEVGVKVDWGRLTTTASLFQIAQPSTIVNVATNSLFVGGEQRNQGLEFNFFGELSEGVRVLGGAMLLSGVLTRTQGGLSDGWIAPFAPGVQFNIGGEWDLPFARGLTLLGRFTYTGSQYIDTTSPRRSLSEWTRLDIGARYTFEKASPTGKPVTLRFNVENVLDNNYWNGTAVDSLMVGPPRTFRLALTSDF